jgi:hypothetical protein
MKKATPDLTGNFSISYRQFKAKVAGEIRGFYIINIAKWP